MASSLIRALFLDWDGGLVQCPNQLSTSFLLEKIVHFPTDTKSAYNEVLIEAEKSMGG